MSEFKSWNSFWDFQQKTSREYRYVRPPEMEDFLKTLISTSKSRETTIPTDKILWRAQLGHGTKPYYQDGINVDDLPAPYPPERMTPLRGKSTEGRANPKGIPSLYLATCRDTALSEVRPWLGSLITLGQFKIKRELKIINCTSTTGHTIYFEEPDPTEREKAVWSDIDRAFAEPITPSDRIAGYAATQIISDLFKVRGYDGIAYRSALGGGYNVALYDIDAAELIKLFLFETKEIKFSFAETAEPYVVRQHHDKKAT